MIPNAKGWSVKRFVLTIAARKRPMLLKSDRQRASKDRPILFGDRAAFVVLAAVMCLAGFAQRSGHVLYSGGAVPQAYAASSSGMILGVCRSAQAAARGTTPASCRSSSGASSWAGGENHRPDFEKWCGSQPACCSERGWEYPTDAMRSLVLTTHFVSECARRGMRTSGRHPPC